MLLTHWLSLLGALPRIWHQTCCPGGCRRTLGPKVYPKTSGVCPEVKEWVVGHGLSLGQCLVHICISGPFETIGKKAVSEGRGPSSGGGRHKLDSPSDSNTTISNRQGGL